MNGQRQYCPGMPRLHHFIVHTFKALKPCDQKRFYVRNNLNQIRIAFVPNFFETIQIRGSRIHHAYSCTRENIMALCKERRLDAALEILHRLDSLDSFIYSGLLQACVRLKAIKEGVQVHAHIIKFGFEVNIFVQNHLINMYAKCQCLESALKVFDKMPERNLVSWTAMIAGYAQEERGEKAIGLFCEMQRVGVGANEFTFGSVLRACASLESLQQAEHVHVHIVKSGYKLDVIVGSALVDTYAKCKNLEYAGRVFDQMPERDAISWNVIIAGYAQNGYGQEALELFYLMQHRAIMADQVTITSVLKACSILAALEHGMQIHAHVFRYALEPDVSVGNALTDMYSKCGNITDARKVFDNIRRQDVISWNTMITGYAQNKLGKEAINLFCKMLLSDVMPNHLTFAVILRACSSETALREGRQIHALVIKSDYQSDISANSALVDMYAKCGSMDDASRVFENMTIENIILWNELIAGYAQSGYGEETMELFFRMQVLGMKPNQFTFVSVLRVCAGLTALELGKQVHTHIMKCTYESDVHVRSALIAIYGKCGSIKEAHKLFDNMLERDVISWSGMIAAYAQHGYGEEALAVFCQMQRAGVKPDQFTFGSLLKACSTLSALEQSKCVHAHVIKRGIEMDVFVGSALVDMYAKCGDVQYGHRVFDKMHKRDEVAWNGMIIGYAQNEHGEEAFKLFCQMRQADIKWDLFAFVGVLKACVSLVALEQGKQVHSHVIKSGFDSETSVGNALIDMYAKCMAVEDSRKFFDKMVHRDVISWSAMIGGYAQNEHSEEALKLCLQMHAAGIKLSEFSFGSSLKACASLAALKQGKQFHACALKTEFESDVFVGSALVDMYAKCGSIDDASNVFYRIPERNIVSWNAMIAGYAQNGCGKDAIQLFKNMQCLGIKPNDVTFVGVLSACSHIGLVDESHHYFNSMKRDYGITPREEHYACMVDLLGRAGRLDEAENFIHRMPVEPHAVVWRTLLAACRIHGNLELAKLAAKRALELEPEDAATYVLLSNIYAATGRWDDALQVRNMMKNKGLKKEAGSSWIEIKNKVHAFVVGDRSHPQMEKILSELERLNEQMKGRGYVPDTKFVLYDVEKEEKELSLSHHSEKLAIAFGLINTLPGTPIRVIKNLRACGDCHTAIKFISKIVKREIVVRDTSRFHYFKDGLCSCGDYW